MRSRSSRVGELDRRPCPRLAPIVILHPGVEVVAEELLELEQARRPQPAADGRPSASGSRRSAGAALAVRRPDRLLDLAHRQVLGDDPPGELLLERPVRGAEQRPGVAQRTSWPSATSAGSPAGAGAAAACW